MARKPIAPGANGRRNSSSASLCVRAGGTAAAVVRVGMGVPPREEGGSGGEGAGGGGQPGLGQEARRAAGGAARAHVRARDHEVVLGAGGGDVEQPPFL